MPYFSFLRRSDLPHSTCCKAVADRARPGYLIKIHPTPSFNFIIQSPFSLLFLQSLYLPSFHPYFPHPSSLSFLSSYYASCLSLLPSFYLLYVHSSNLPNFIPPSLLPLPFHPSLRPSFLRSFTPSFHIYFPLSQLTFLTYASRSSPFHPLFLANSIYSLYSS